jgi:hypothetical protein
MCARDRSSFAELGAFGGICEWVSVLEACGERKVSYNMKMVV